MKVIFLDIDGVMNGQNFYERTKKFKYWMFDPNAVKFLNKLVKKTGAKIVISSSWRKGKKKSYFKKIFKKNKIKAEVIGMTDVLHFKNWNRSVFRGCEIQKWLDDHAIEIDDHTNSLKRSKYVILDDDVDMLFYHRNNFVNTYELSGFDEEAYNQALKILINET